MSDHDPPSAVIRSADEARRAEALRAAAIFHAPGRRRVSGPVAKPDTWSDVLATAGEFEAYLRGESDR